MSQPAAPAKKGLSGRAIGGIVVAVVVLIFIFTNWQSVEVKFLFLSPTMPLAIALALAAAGGLHCWFPDRPQSLQEVAAHHRLLPNARWREMMVMSSCRRGPGGCPRQRNSSRRSEA